MITTLHIQVPLLSMFNLPSFCVTFMLKRFIFFCWYGLLLAPVLRFKFIFQFCFCCYTIFYNMCVSSFKKFREFLL